MNALSGVTAEFRRGALTLVMGPSGSGKTTLLSLVGCLLSPEQGEVFIENVAVSKLSESQRTAVRKKSISFVFQAFRLFHSLSAIDNVALGFQLRGITGGHRAARKLLSRFALEDAIHQKPHALSPGQKQRVAIARALAGDPPILLADEPTASVDHAAAKNICQILREQVEREQRTVVVVSHDARWQEFADTTLVIADGQIQDEVHHR